MFWGIATDNLSTTHPITTTCADTNEAEGIFDGISYGKGGNILKQVYKLMGHERMQAGLHRYFDRFKWKNTELCDFVSTLAEVWKENPDTSFGADFDFEAWFM